MNKNNKTKFSIDETQGQNIIRDDQGFVYDYEMYFQKNAGN